MIKRLLALFKPNDFKDDFYGWLTNQISHVAFSCSVVYLFYLVFPCFSTLLFPAAFFCFWVVWEVRHLKQTGNLRDFMQDLFFESAGIAIYFFPKLLIFVALLFIATILNSIYKNGK